MNAGMAFASPGMMVSMAVAILAVLPVASLAYAEPVVDWPPDLIVTNATGFLTRVDIEPPRHPGQDLEIIASNPVWFPVGSTTVTWLARDDAGNRAASTTTVVILDTDPPKFLQAQHHVKYYANSSKKIPVQFAIPDAVDAADIDVEVTSTHEPGSKFQIGNTTVTFAATDDSGNSISHDMVVTVERLVVRDLRLERTHDSIRATWEQFGDHVSYGVTLTESDTGKKIQDARIRGTVHTFSHLEPDTGYDVLVYVTGNKQVKARESVSTLPPPFLARDDFTDIGGWTFGSYPGYTFARDDNEGNPAPSGRISGATAASDVRSYPAIRQSFDLDGRDGKKYFAVHFKSDSSEPPTGTMALVADGRYVYGKALWGPASSPYWLTLVEEVSRYVGNPDRIEVRLGVRSDPGDAYTMHFDNLYLATAPPSTFRGGSADEYALTPEQEEFDRVLLQALNGEIDPYEYINGTKELAQYNDLLKDMLAPLVGTGTGFGQ